MMSNIAPSSPRQVPICQCQRSFPAESQYLFRFVIAAECSLRAISQTPAEPAGMRPAGRARSEHSLPTGCGEPLYLTNAITRPAVPAKTKLSWIR
jgi:hypothetical protein